MIDLTGTGLQQSAPYPFVLHELVKALHYKEGWRFLLQPNMDRGQDSRGMTLLINVNTTDAYHPGRMISVNHYMIVPAAAYDMRSWRRWLFDQIGLVEDHERAESFMIGDDRPYAPSHGPGNDPYLIREIGTDEDRRTSYLGELKGAEHVSG